MNLKWSNYALAWTARVLSILFILLNTWGWWDESQARQEPKITGEVSTDWLYNWAILTHVLPILLIIVATIIGWQRPFYGAIGFIIFALVQAIGVGTEFEYLPAVLALPLLVTLPYLIGWLTARKQTTKTSV